MSDISPKKIWLSLLEIYGPIRETEPVEEPVENRYRAALRDLAHAEQAYAEVVAQPANIDRKTVRRLGGQRVYAEPGDEESAAWAAMRAAEARVRAIIREAREAVDAGLTAAVDSIADPERDRKRLQWAWLGVLVLLTLLLIAQVGETW